MPRRIPEKICFTRTAQCTKRKGLFVQRESADYTGAIIVRKYNWSIIVSLDDRGKHPRSFNTGWHGNHRRCRAEVSINSVFPK